MSRSQTHSPDGKAKVHSPRWSPPATFPDFLSDLRFHLLHLQQSLLPVALRAAALSAEDEQGCGQWRGRSGLESPLENIRWPVAIYRAGLEGEVLLASSPPPLGRVWEVAGCLQPAVLPSLVG